MTEPAQKLISICIPTFNRANYLKETLESILPQLGPDIEVVVSDNGSTDDTKSIVLEYQQKNPDIRYFSNDANLGFDRNLLRCLEHASGEYVWFFGSDDVLNEGGVETVRRRILDASARPALVYLNHDVVDNRGELLIRSQVGCEKDREFPSAPKCLEFLRLNLGFLSALVVRQEPSAQVASAAEFVGSEWLHLHLVLCSLLAGGSVQYVGRPSVRARRSLSFANDLTKVFVGQVDRIFWDAHRRGYPWLTVYRTMNGIVKSQYARIALAWRCDDAEQLRRSYPVLRGTCWKYPWFWLLIVPLRYTPRWLAVAFRNRLRALRTWRNSRLSPQTIPTGTRKAGLPG